MDPILVRMESVEAEWVTEQIASLESMVHRQLCIQFFLIWLPRRLIRYIDQNSVTCQCTMEAITVITIITTIIGTTETSIRNILRILMYTIMITVSYLYKIGISKIFILW